MWEALTRAFNDVIKARVPISPQILACVIETTRARVRVRENRALLPSPTLGLPREREGSCEGEYYLRFHHHRTHAPMSSAATRKPNERE
jgi:hypothetical protein